jgi:hypothetical protein
MLMENFRYAGSLISKPAPKKQITLASIPERFKDKELLTMSKDKTFAGQAVSSSYQVVVVLFANGAQVRPTNMVCKWTKANSDVRTRRSGQPPMLLKISISRENANVVAADCLLVTDKESSIETARADGDIWFRSVALVKLLGRVPSLGSQGLGDETVAGLGATYDIVEPAGAKGQRQSVHATLWDLGRS